MFNLVAFDNKGFYTLTGVTLGAVEGVDVMAAAGTPLPEGNLVATGAPDAWASAVLTVTTAASLAATEARDTISATMIETTTASFALSEGVDTLVGALQEITFADLAGTDVAGTMTGSVKLTTLATFALTDTPDVLAGTSSIRVSATFAAFEDNDFIVSVSEVYVATILSSYETRDIFGAHLFAGEFNFRPYTAHEVVFVPSWATGMSMPLNQNTMRQKWDPDKSGMEHLAVDTVMKSKARKRDTVPRRTLQ